MLAGCAGSGSAAGQSGPGFVPFYQQVRCPADVEVQLVVENSCGYLTVLQDPAKPDGLRVKVFVVKIIPNRRKLPPDPVLAFGYDLGFGAQFGDTAPLAERVGRVAYLMDPRGTGHSLPSLACPEVNELTSAGLTARTGDPNLLGEFLKAVRACRDRLTQQGINVADYDLAAVADDAKDLREALGIRRWNLGSYGSYSGALLQTLRIDAGGVRAAFIDSPVLPQASLFSGAPGAMAWALGQLFNACRQESTCSHAVSDLRQDWSRALVPAQP